MIKELFILFIVLCLGIYFMPNEVISIINLIYSFAEGVVEQSQVVINSTNSTSIIN
jgi:hypothetical protein